MVAVPSLGHAYLSMERDVAITAGSGSADFGLPPIITVHFLDAPIGSINAAGISMGTEGTITMPDGEDAWVTSVIDTNWNLGETAHFPMVRVAEAGMNLYEMDPWDVHGWVIDLIAATEFTYVPGGEILAGDPVTDTDGDGVLDVVENTAGLQVCSCPPDGDGNGDGTDDRLQSNVSSRPSFYGGSITYASASGTILSGLRGQRPVGPRTGPRGLRHPCRVERSQRPRRRCRRIDRAAPPDRVSPQRRRIRGGRRQQLDAAPPANVATDPNWYWTDLTLIDGGLGDLDGAGERFHLRARRGALRRGHGSAGRPVRHTADRLVCGGRVGIVHRL